MHDEEYTTKDSETDKLYKKAAVKLNKKTSKHAYSQ